MGGVGPPPLVSPGEATPGLMYNPYEYNPYATAFHQAATLIDYPTQIDQSAGMFSIVR